MNTAEILSTATEETEKQIRCVLISHVENDRRLNLGDDDERYDRYRRVYHSICEGLSAEIGQKWWAWGTLEGFTII